MHGSFGLFTALPLDWEPADVAGSWSWTAVVGLVLGVVWLVVQGLGAQVGGPFVAAGTVLLVHVTVTGARPVRGLAAVVAALITDPDDGAGRGLPGPAGAAPAVVTVVLVTMTGFLIPTAVAPAVLVAVPLVGRTVQALLLSDADGTGLPAPTGRQRVVVGVTAAIGMAVLPLASLLDWPRRIGGPLDGIGYVLLGLVALVVALLVGLAWRAWLRVRFTSLDAAAWHSIGAVADLAALAVVAARIR